MFNSHLFWVLVHYYWRRLFIFIFTGAITSRQQSWRHRRLEKHQLNLPQRHKWYFSNK